jgi:hypothetical protein
VAHGSLLQTVLLHFYCVCASRPDFVPAMEDDYEEPGKRKRAPGHQDDTSGPQTARFSDSMPFGCASGRPFFEAWRGVVTGES